MAHCLQYLKCQTGEITVVISHIIGYYPGAVPGDYTVNIKPPTVLSISLHYTSIKQQINQLAQLKAIDCS